MCRKLYRAVVVKAKHMTEIGIKALELSIYIPLLKRITTMRTIILNVIELFITTVVSSYHGRLA